MGRVTMGRRANLLFCTAAIWVAVAPPAFAQDRPPEALPDAAEANDDGAIVVTARRREERLADVPTAASVIDITSLTDRGGRSEETTSELQSLMRNTSAVFCLKKQTINTTITYS